MFISGCQTRYSEEERIAQDVATELKGMGYDPYVAIEEHTFEAVKDNIFQKLKESEYFLFIDFKREEFKDVRIGDPYFLLSRACFGCLLR